MKRALNIHQRAAMVRMAKNHPDPVSVHYSCARSLVARGLARGAGRIINLSAAGHAWIKRQNQIEPLTDHN